jgi:hypothetical protein
MSLIDHARAALILSDELCAASREAKVEAGKEEQQGNTLTASTLTTVGLTLFAMAGAHRRAAERMEEVIRTELLDHACSIDHRGLPAGRKCPACGAPKG